MTRITGTLVIIAAFLVAIGYLIPGCAHHERIMNPEEMACMEKFTSSKLPKKIQADFYQICHDMFADRFGGPSL